MSTPLVAQAQSTTTGVTGIGLLESAQDLSNGVKDGSWVEGGLGALGTGLEVLSMVIDPLGTLAQYGVAWLIEHVRPLKEALDWLAGDPPVIQSFSETWANVAAEVGALAGDLGNEVKNGTAGWSGDAAETYRGAGAEQAEALAGAASLADGISTGVMIMGTVVAFVREMVRDIVAELVGKLITWALEAACTLGFATPLIAAQATTAISSAVTRISEFVRKLVKTVGNVSPRLGRIIEKLDEIVQSLRRLGRKLGGGDGTTPSAAHGGGGKVDTPDVGDATTPSGTHAPDGGDVPSGRADGTSPSSTDSPNRPASEADTKTPQDSRTKCNDPIDVATGEMILPQVDLELGGELPLVLSRTHVSSYRAGRSFGPSWASTVDQRLEFDQRGVLFLSEDGMILSYVSPADDGTPVYPSLGPRWPLSRSADGFVIAQPESGRHLHFSVSGAEAPLVAITDRNANRIDFLRESDGTVHSVAHSGGYRVHVESEDGLITRLRLAGGQSDVALTSYWYESRNLVEVRNSSGAPLVFSYDDAGRITRWEDRNGRWYRYLYDEVGRCVANEGSGGFLNGTFSYEHRLTRFTDALGHTTTFEFNDLNQLVRELDPLGNEIRRSWDRFDRLLTETDPLGRTTTNEYDDNGNLIAVIRPDGSRREAEYNESGQPVLVVEPDGATWRQEYDDRGNLIAVADPAGACTRYEYDRTGAVSAVTDAHGATHRVENDAAGLPLAVVDPLGNTTRYTRDVFGRVCAIRDPAGGTTRIGWTVEGLQAWLVEPGGATRRWSYDGEGNETRHVDAAGGVTVSEYTHMDLLSARIDPDGSRTEFTYDPMLRLIAVTNAQGLVWRYEYDAAGNLVGETDFNGRGVRYEYDAAGQLVRRTNALGQVTGTEYDLLGNVVRRRGDDGVEARFEFDPQGRLVRAVNADADVRLVRDRLGRVIREQIGDAAVVSEFDLMGRRVQRRTPSGAVSSWRYDDNNQPVELVVGSRALTFAYDAAGRQVERTIAGIATVRQAWDADHRLTSQSLSAVAPGSGGSPVLQHRAYRYRPDGVVTAIDDLLRGTRRFGTDRMGRVITAQGPGWAEQYGYDQLGNVGSAQWLGGESELQGPRAIAGTLVHTAGRVRYQHDACGRVVLIQKVRLSAKPDNWHLEWNSDNRLTSVVTPDGTTWRYRYDALGRRTAKQRLAADRRTVVEQLDFAWDGAHLAEQLNSSGHATTWEWDRDGERPLVQVHRAKDASQEWIDAAFYAMITDLVGAPTEMVDPAGRLVWQARTNVWGHHVGVSDVGVTTPLRFPGQYFDPETGLHYNVQRYYDPGSVRYLSPDPLGLDGGANQHAYVQNPLTWLDPLGLKGKECWENASRAKKSTPAGRLTAPQQRDMAKFVGLKETKAKMKGQPVFTDGKRYYTYDIDGHNGGLFKVAKDVKALASKDSRAGTLGLGRPAGSNEPWGLYQVGD